MLGLEKQRMMPMNITSKSIRGTLLGMALLLTPAGCSNIKENANWAAAELDTLLGVERAESGSAPQEQVADTPAPSSESAPSSAPAEKKPTVSEEHKLYLAGVAAREDGAHETALRNFLAASRLGHVAASYEIAQAYLDGRGVSRNDSKGREWLEVAAKRGDARARYDIGAAYYHGNGVPQDYGRAVQYLSKAAVQGHPEAQFLVGEAFSNGYGVEKNPAWAARWYGKAARQGLSEAQFAYGAVEAAGVGLPKNRVSGHRWLTLAALQGHEQAVVLRLALSKQMTTTEIKDADKLATDFKPVTRNSLADQPTVMYVQFVLNSMGYDAGDVDGLLGPQTRDAIGSFQKQEGIKKDGSVSPALLRRLLAQQGAPEQAAEAE
jgi:TPR repeat protein